jgi:two-component system response regulator TctD
MSNHSGSRRSERIRSDGDPAGFDLSGTPVLVVDDDLPLRTLYARTLERVGLAVVTAAGVLDARSVLRTTRPAAAVLDVGLEDESGLVLLDELPADAVRIVATAYRDLDLLRRLLARGVDEVVFKPLVMEEFGARLLGRLAARRRSAPAAGSACLRFVPATGSALCTRFGRRIALSGSEARALAVLVEAGGAVVTREALAQQVHGEAWDPSSRRIDALVSRLRRKLACEHCGVQRELSTVHGLGYRLVGVTAG